jgi:hypothetical protein
VAGNDAPRREAVLAAAALAAARCVHGLEAMDRIELAIVAASDGISMVPWQTEDR